MRSPLLPMLPLTVLLTGCLGGAVSERFLVPRDEWLAEPSDLGLAFEDVVLETGAATTVHGWFLPAPAGDGRTVLLCHGNAANISFYHPYYSFLHAAGWNVLLHDYRGYGKSEGDVDVAALFSDTEAMLEHLRSRPDVDREKVVLFGASLGSIVALRTAARRPVVAAVVAECVSSPDEVLTRALGGALAWLVEVTALPGDLEPADNAARLACPSLFVCGAWDFDLSAHLRAFHRAPEPAACWVLPATGHAPNPLMVHDGEYQDAIVAFLDEAVEGRVPRVEASLWRRDEATLHVQLTNDDAASELPIPVEVCVVDADGQAQFFQRWLQHSTDVWSLPYAAEPASITAWRYRRVAATPDGASWVHAPGPLARAGDARTTLTALATLAAQSATPLADARAFLETLAYFEQRLEFPALLEAELVPVWLAFGRVLLGSDVEAERNAGVALLRRCVAAEPPVHGLHYWPDVRYVAGFAYARQVEEARALLR